MKSIQRVLQLSLNKKRREKLDRIIKINNLTDYRDAVNFVLDTYDFSPLTTEQLVSRYVNAETREVDIVLRDRNSGLERTFKTTAADLREARELYSPYLTFCAIVRFDGKQINE